jgi:hypothetical protein
MGSRSIVSRHWHVTENTPGYLPESDPFVTRSRSQARRHAIELRSGLRELGYRVVTGSIAEGTVWLAQGTEDLGRVVEIIECSDPSCEVTS